MSRKAQRAAELEAQRKADLAREREAVAVHWQAEHEFRAAEEEAAQAALADAQTHVVGLRWRAEHPSERWPLADLEHLCARQDLLGAEARVNAAQEARRAAQWNLRC